MLEQTQRADQLRAAGHRRRARVQRESTIRSRHRLAIGGEVAREVAELYGAALAAEIGNNATRDLATIERISAAAGDLLEGPRQIRIAQRVTGAERLPVSEKERAGSVVLEKMLTLGGERGGESFTDDVAVARGVNCRGENVGPSHLAAAVFLHGEVHGGDRSRNVGEHWTVVRQAAILQQSRVVEARRLGHARHEFDQLRLRHRRPVDEHLSIAAEAARVRLDHA